MTKYIFYDTDESGNEDYDICGAHYKQLIHLCCQYCTVFSTVVTQPFSEIYGALKQFEIVKPSNIEIITGQYGPNGVTRFFYICPELEEVLLKIQGIFDWMDGWGKHNPMDPTFYREDGSVLFTSTIHDGYCLICPNENENVEKIITNDHWKEIDLPPNIWWIPHVNL